jgi:hypothetical protein
MTNRRLPEDRAAAHFKREKHLVELLMQRLGQPAHDYRDPNLDAGRETGADVLMVSNGRRIGIQVTEMDTGHVQSRARAEEKKERSRQTVSIGTARGQAQSGDRGEALV